MARTAGDYLDAPAKAALVVIETGALRPSAALRKLAESHDAAMALPCYEADARQVSQLMRDQLEAEGFRIEAAALEAAVARLTTDRGIMRREIERLVLYKGPRGSAGFSADTALITLDDVDAALGDQSSLTLDSLIDAVALGRVAAADQRLRASRPAGKPCSPRWVLCAGTFSFAPCHRTDRKRHATKPSAFGFSATVTFQTQAFGRKSVAPVVAPQN